MKCKLLGQVPGTMNGSDYYHFSALALAAFPVYLPDPLSQLSEPFSVGFPRYALTLDLGCSEGSLCNAWEPSGIKAGFALWTHLL